MRKKSLKVKTSVSLSEDLIQLGKIVGEKEDRSFSWIVDRALRAWLDKSESGDESVGGVKGGGINVLKQNNTQNTPSLKVPPQPTVRRRSRTVLQKPPSLEDVKAHMLEKWGSAAEANNFVDYWESQGWQRRGGPLRSWRAAVRSWMRKSKEYKSWVGKSKENGAVNAVTRSIDYSYPDDEHKNPRF